jgi:tRNA 2-selenouridine synthase SelU
MKLLLDDLKEDVILKVDLVNPSGRVLLCAGSVLSVATAKRLKNWGIFYVDVEGEESKEVLVENEHQDVEEIKRNLKMKFERTLNNPIMKKLFDAVLEHKLKNRQNPS